MYNYTGSSITCVYKYIGTSCGDQLYTGSSITCVYSTYIGTCSCGSLVQHTVKTYPPLAFSKRGTREM